MPKEAQRRVLITGGAGFIGSHLCERLLSLQDSLVVLDNFNDFYHPQVKRDNISKRRRTARSSRW